MRCRGSYGGVEGDIGSAFLGGSSGNVAAALPIRTSKSSTAALLASDAIDRVLQAPGGKCGTYLYFVATFPPAGIERIYDGLVGGFGLAKFSAILLGFLGYALALTFFRSSS